MNHAQTQRSLSNVCLFCNEVLPNPTLCKFCGFKFCDEHISTTNHQCIKTRYLEYVERTANQPNISNGKFKVICNVCGYVSEKATPIEYAGEELEQHMQMIGCPDNIFLKEFESEPQTAAQAEITKEPPKVETPTPVPSTDTADLANESSVVEQILKLSSFKDKGMISDDEFQFIKKELIKKLK